MDVFSCSRSFFRMGSLNISAMLKEFLGEELSCKNSVLLFSLLGSAFQG